MGLLQIFSLLSSARNIKSTLATARGTVTQLKESAEHFQTAAFQRTREKAMAGDPQAQYDLGECYYEGRAVARDQEEAFRWFRDAAQRGLAKAQCSVGLMLFFGRGIPRDREQGYTWLTLSAAQAYEPAMRAQERAAQKLDSSTKASAERRAAAFQPGPA